VSVLNVLQCMSLLCYESDGRPFKHANTAAVKWPISTTCSNSKQGNRWSHFARAVHSHRPLPGRSLLQRTRYTALSVGKKNHRIAHFPWNFVTLP